MAFHTPDPKLRAIEQRNAELRARAFGWVFRTAARQMIRFGRLVRRGVRRAATAVRRGRP